MAGTKSPASDIELTVARTVNRAIHNHIRRHHPLLWSWIWVKSHAKTLYLALNTPNGGRHVWNAVKEFWRDESSGGTATKSEVNEAYKEAMKETVERAD